jgi:UDP:flavonoid glycosyltransferase YjiC (YdhE family)
MKVIVIAAGTAGNVLPFIGLSIALRDRGHEVLLGASRNCREIAARESLPYAEVDQAEQESSDETSQKKSVFDNWNRLLDWSKQLVPVVYRLIADHYVPGKTVVICHGFLFGARIAQDHLGVPVVTVHLQPGMLRSFHDWPWYMPAAGIWTYHRCADSFIDQSFGKPVNRLRSELGLGTVTRLMHRWWFSPTLTVGFFPEWYSARQPDWPDNLLLAGFPLYDNWQLPADRSAFDTFMDEGPPPLVFSQASLIKDSRAYFSTCAEIATRLKRRAILLTATPEYLPSPLPDGVRSFGFVPLSEILPRSAAFIHHGGLGSISQALAAGIPQLTVPAFLDQPDNSRRLLKLGVSDNIRVSQFKPEFVAPRIEALLDSKSVAERCKYYAQLSQTDDAFSRVADAIERLEPSVYLEQSNVAQP